MRKIKRQAAALARGSGVGASPRAPGGRPVRAHAWVLRPQLGAHMEGTPPRVGLTWEASD